MELPRIATRSTASTVRFAHAFCLGGDTRELSPGSYPVYTEQDVYQRSAGTVAVATSVDLPVGNGASRCTRIARRSDLQEALARGVVKCDLSRADSENRDRGRAGDR